MSTYRNSQIIPAGSMTEKTGSPLRFGLCLIVTLALCASSYAALKRSWAAFQADAGEAWLQSWRTTNERAMPFEDWDIGHEALRHSIEQDSRNAWHHGELSQMMLWRMNDPRLKPAERLKIAEEGLEHARQDVAGRPAWPYAWAGLLQWKALVVEIDDEFRLSLERCNTLGPWETPVQQIAVQVGSAYWDRLNETDRASVTGAALRGLAQQERQMAAIISQTGLGDAVCAELGSSPQLADRYCESLKD